MIQEACELADKALLAADVSTAPITDFATAEAARIAARDVDKYWAAYAAARIADWFGESDHDHYSDARLAGAVEAANNALAGEPAP